MKKRTLLLAFIVFLTSVQLLAQCRLVRVEASDTSMMSYYTYDKQGRLSIEKTISSNAKVERHFAYNDKNKVVNLQAFQNDTLNFIKDYIYEKGILTHVYSIKPKDTIMSVGTLIYNDKGQVVRFFNVTKNGDTASWHYEYAPEGWLKRIIYEDSKPNNNFKVEISWDDDQKAIDPFRIYFDGYANGPFEWNRPTDPLSVKGDWKSWTYYKMDKEGKFLKDQEGEAFDIKGNAEGLWTENKFRIIGKDKVVTHRGFYEGCKN